MATSVPLSLEVNVNFFLRKEEIASCVPPKFALHDHLPDSANFLIPVNTNLNMNEGYKLLRHSFENACKSSLVLLRQ